MAKVTLAFSCDSERDADIVAWAEKQDNLSAALRAAVRASWLQNGLTLGDVLNELGEVKRLLRAGVVVHTDDATEPETQDPETTAAQAALDSLGL